MTDAPPPVRHEAWTVLVVIMLPVNLLWICCVAGMIAGTWEAAPTWAVWAIVLATLPMNLLTMWYIGMRTRKGG